MSIHEVIASLKDADKKKFFELRNVMRRAYLVSMHNTIGIKNYSIEDDVQLDKIDNTVGALMKRAVMDKPITTGEEEPKPPAEKVEIVGTKELKQLETALTGKSEPKPWGAK